MKIKVTQGHIKAGQKSEPERCPIALAVKEATGLLFASVGSTAVALVSNGTNFKLPRKAQNFIRAFDNNESVKPFTFEI